MEFVPVAVLASLVLKFTDFGKLVSAKNWSGVTTQLVAWGSGILATFLFASSDFAGGIEVGAGTLATLNGASLVLVGMSIASTAGVVYDVKRAVDSSDSAKMPELLPKA